MDLDDDELKATREYLGVDSKKEDKIEVGEYVRTKKGDIDKIDRYIFESNIYHCENGMCIDTENRIGLHLEDIVKHSKNIIDLIKEGDYVNGYEVITVYGYDENGNDKDELGICEVDDDYAYYTYLEDIDIKSIVTKERFESIKYKIEEN